MFHFRDKPWWVIAALICLLTIICVGSIALRNYHNSQEYLDRTIAKLPADITAPELEQRGFLNLTDIQPEAIPRLSAFFNTSTPIAVVQPPLKTFTEEDGDLVLRCFVQYRRSVRVHMTVYQRSGGFAPARTAGYQLNSETAFSEDGIAEVWLREVTIHASPMGDLLLYRYFCDTP